MKFLLILWLLSISALAQPQAPTNNPPPVEVLKYKIGTDYYPMLDRKNPITTADNPDFPRPENERVARRSRAAQMEEVRSRGKLRSQIRVIDQAEWVNVQVKNTGNKTIKQVDWDFAFARQVNGQTLTRYDVSTKVEIKPGGKKNLKQLLPVGAKRCQAIMVTADEKDKAKVFEAVCGPGFIDPSIFKNQETITIKRIEYVDGSVWGGKP